MLSYEDRWGRWLDIRCEGGEVTFMHAHSHSPVLTLDQAGVIAEKIRKWQKIAATAAEKGK